MRMTLLAATTLLGMATVLPAFAQPASPMPAFPGREPSSAVAANIAPPDTRSDIAPQLRAPPLGPDATPAQLLQQAHVALTQKRSGEVQEALERAETRLLDRATAPSAAGTPDSAPAIQQIARARAALGRQDWQQADLAIAAALQAAQSA
jgi:hypothetical protein